MDLAEQIGILLKNMPNLHDIEFKIGFSIHENTFLQKLVSSSNIDKGVRIKSGAFHKGLLFIDYFCTVLDNDFGVCDNLVTISKKFRDAERKKKEDKGASYLDFGLVVLEVGLYSKEKGDSYYAGCKDEIKTRYMSEPAIDINSDSLRKIEPYYGAIGAMVVDLVSDERKPFLGDARNRLQLNALVFTDCVLGWLKDQNYVQQVKDELQKKEYLQASLTALKALTKEASIEEMKQFISGEPE